MDIHRKFGMCMATTQWRNWHCWYHYILSRPSNTNISFFYFKISGAFCL